MKHLLLASVFSMPVAVVALVPSASHAETYSFTGNSSSTLTYAPSILSGVNTNITSYSSSFKWIYSLYPFIPKSSGTYSVQSTTTGVVNTSFVLSGTYTPTTTFPPTTPISQFIASNFSGANTTTIPSLVLTGGETYSVLVAYNQTTAGTYPYTVTLVFDGPGCVEVNNRTCPTAAANTAKPNANMPASAVDVGRSFGRVITGRLGQLRSATGSISTQASSGFGSASFSQTGSLSDASGGVATSDDGDGTVGMASGDAYQNEGRGMWGRAFGATSNNRGKGDSLGFDRKTSGALVGTDMQVSNDVRVGVAVGYARSNITGDEGSGKTRADSYHGSVYGDWSQGAVFLAADAGLTWNAFQNARYVETATASEVASSDSTALDVGGGLELGYRAQLGGFSVEPSVSLRYDLIRSNGYTETGAGTNNVTVDDATHHAMSTGLGVSVSRTFELESGLKLEPDVSVRWEHDLLDTGFETNQTLNGVTTAVRSADPGRDAAVLGLGVAALLDDDFKLFAHYDTELRARQTDHAITAGARYTW